MATIQIRCSVPVHLIVNEAAWLSWSRSFFCIWQKSVAKVGWLPDCVGYIQSKGFFSFFFFSLFIYLFTYCQHLLDFFLFFFLRNAFRISHKAFGKADSQRFTCSDLLLVKRDRFRCNSIVYNGLFPIVLIKEDKTGSWYLSTGTTEVSAGWNVGGGGRGKQVSVQKTKGSR